MIRIPRAPAPTSVAAALLLAVGLGGVGSGGRAFAQYGGGPGAPGGGMPAPPMGQEPKEEGPAEAAPEDDNRPSDLEPLSGYAEQSRKRVQIFEVDGYLRLRSDYLHNFFLSQPYSNTRVMSPGGGPTVAGTPPFPVPLGCPVPTANAVVTKDPGGPGVPCGTKGMGSANLRLRLEPTLNVTDQVRVHAQIDVLDNTLMGSTPDSLVGINRNPQDGLPGAAPASFVYTTQDPPEVGQNGYLSSIRAKRAWGEIDSEFGSLRFGRMPWHFGRGIAYNDGNCPDCDLGTTVDRLMALTQLYGHQIAVAWDFGAQGVTTQQLNLGRDDPGNYPIDLSQDDDVVQLMASITKIDNPVQLRERIDRGDLVVNYGFQVVYRSQQSRSIMPSATTVAASMLTAPTREQFPGLTPFGGLTVTPDIWFKLHFKALTVEFEGSAVLGKIDHPGPAVGENAALGLTLAADDQRLTIRQFGWVVASELRLYRDSFFVGVETGGATGDQAEDRSKYLNYRWRFVEQPNGDHAINDFKFSPDYHVDEILFRHILGTVTNAIYIKPQVAYWYDLQQSRQIGLTGAVIYSLAQVPVSTPGNALSYGIEMNLGVNYRNTAEGFYAGATWGVLWPLSALDRPASVWFADAANANAAQILRAFFGIRF
jgi:uncharacterized protein (TIGR04551 family)